MRIGIAAGALLAGAGFLLPPPAPIKMGLWEVTTTATSQMTGKMADAMANMGQKSGVPQTMVTKLCVTEETWQKSLGGMADPSPGCVRSDVVSTPAKLSGKLTCTRATTSMAADQTTFFDSPEQVHATQHMTSSSPNGTSATDSTIKAKFLSSDCGDVKPLGQRMMPH